MSNRRIQQHEWTRRQMILSGVSMAALPWLGRQSWAAVSVNPRFADNPFTLGVASGDPTSDGVVLWTRLAPDPLHGGGLPAEDFPVRWELAADEGFRKIVQSGTELATAAMGHSVHVEVRGLRRTAGTGTAFIPVMPSVASAGLAPCLRLMQCRNV